MIPIAEARLFVLSGCAPLPPRRVSLEDSAWHVLAQTVLASEDIPRFANSAMDGYAVRWADTKASPVRLRVVGTVMAGQSPVTAVGEGEAVRIMTGAPMPPGADAVCMVENTRTESDGSVVVIETPVEDGMFVRRAGGDIASGEEVFAPGALLTPPHLGVLASLGVESVAVHPRPRVGVISTGDELSDGPDPLPPGKIRDANRPSLLAQLRTDRFEVGDLGVAKDDETALSRLLEDASSEFDAVVASGGVSVGDRDVVRFVLEKLGGESMRWMQVAVRPAKPFAFGVLGPSATPVFGLPGNPVSALVSYELFVRPALRSMAGHKSLDRPRFKAIVDVDCTRRPDGKVHLIRVLACTASDGSIHVDPSRGQESHMLHALAEANALAILPDGNGVRAGASLDVLLLDAERLQLPDDPGPW